MSRLPRKTVGEMFTVILPIYIGTYSTIYLSQVPDNKFMIILLVILTNEKLNKYHNLGFKLLFKLHYKF